MIRRSPLITIVETEKGRSLNVTGRGVIAEVIEWRSLWSRLRKMRSLQLISVERSRLIMTLGTEKGRSLGWWKGDRPIIDTIAKVR
ncbi:MAG: hypothetical protein F6K30_11650 [Cyanothece sp. SIO2G6]|nr:hypothetical protein [Cyanothece sp. SIO2G6]